MNNINNLIDFIDELNYIGHRRAQVFDDRPNYFDILTVDEFIYRFRLSKKMCSLFIKFTHRKIGNSH